MLEYYKQEQGRREKRILVSATCERVTGEDDEIDYMMM